ncbi:MAG: HNH endonuclease [Planctomycetia bacterium]|jgi:5-methylcytosine-specific restriction endonuclease McrA|nr:HNH endonuclease [Planctomycetia bacterium]MCC7315972.1 HNH endonuclease [Planctomycetota bacterium]OQZ05607.1 MAG: HNH endonuclease [Planctomycetes bacterium UTPLA1]
MYAHAGGLSCNVLVLNQNYLAIRVVNVRRAFSLLFKELAEVVHIERGQYASYDFMEWCELSELAREFEPDAHDWIRTVRFDIAVPRIIRLAFYDRLPRQQVKFNRRNLYARDENRCQYCGKKHSTTELSLDHVVPRSMGGKTSWENIVCACLKCNIRKGGRTPEMAGMHLISTPKKPKRNPVITVKLADDRYASWKAFLDNAYWSVELK